MPTGIRPHPDRRPLRHRGAGRRPRPAQGGDTDRLCASASPPPSPFSSSPLGRLLFGPGPTDAVTLPLGIPWIGAHFRIDALSAFFLVVINLSAAGASLYAIGYGRHESSPERVLPFYPAFLAAHESRPPRRRRLHLPGQLGVHVARLVGAGHRPSSRRRERARRLRLSGHGERRHARASPRLRPPRRSDRRLRLRRHPRRRICRR